MRLQRDNTFTRWPGAFSVSMCLNVIVFWKWMRWTTEPSLITTYGRFYMSIFRQDDISTPKPCLPTCGYLPTYSSIYIYPSTHLPIYPSTHLSLSLSPSLFRPCWHMGWCSPIFWVGRRGENWRTRMCDTCAARCRCRRQCSRSTSWFLRRARDASPRCPFVSSPPGEWAMASPKT